MSLRCVTHPRYAAKRKPRVLCEACWAFWFAEKDLRDRLAWLERQPRVKDEDDYFTHLGRQ